MAVARVPPRGGPPRDHQVSQFTPDTPALVDEVGLPRVIHWIAWHLLQHRGPEKGTRPGAGGRSRVA